MPITITRLEIARQASRATGISVEDCVAVLNASVSAMHEELARGNEISVRRFGRFSLKNRKAKIANQSSDGRFSKNPDVAVLIPAHLAVVFDPGRDLKFSVAKLPVVQT